MFTVRLPEVVFGKVFEIICQDPPILKVVLAMLDILTIEEYKEDYRM